MLKPGIKNALKAAGSFGGRDVGDDHLADPGVKKA
jgi:hypothetical protein